jgi:mono/diheme cytochrome c family protein
MTARRSGSSAAGRPAAHCETSSNFGLGRLAALLLVATAVFAAGCGGGGEETTGLAAADVSGGREIFTARCASCHILAAAGGPPTDVGPNLDSAFGYAREQGFDKTTFYEITLDMVSGLAAPPMPDFTEDPQKLAPQERVNVAAFVATCAGQGIADLAAPGCEAAPGGSAEGEMDPETLFSSQGCGSCHTFGPAGSVGTVGPNLDESSITLEQAIEQITNGGGAMPPYADRLSAEQIRALAEFVTGG